MPNSEEKALVGRAKQGDQEAFAALMQQYEKPIYNLCLRMCRQNEDAEELCQTSFLKAWRSLPGFLEDASFFTWLYRLASNTCIDFLRREARRNAALPSLSLDGDEERELQIPDLRHLPENSLLQKDLRESLLSAMEQLSAEHRHVLIQRELDGLSYQEISDILGLELGTVKSRIARARTALRQILQKEGNFFEAASSKETDTGKGGGS